MCCNRKVEIEQVQKSFNEHSFSWNFQFENGINLGRVQVGKVESNLENREIVGDGKFLFELGSNDRSLEIVIVENFPTYVRCFFDADSKFERLNISWKVF